MFETLFKYPHVVARHRTGPAAEARERFLKHCVGQGLAGATVLRHARELLGIAARIEIASGEPVGSPAVEMAADCWVRQQHDRHRVHALQGSRKLFVQTATSWLHFLGLLEEPQPKTVPFPDRLIDFAAYQRDERGLSPATIRGQGWQVEKFLSWLSEQKRAFDQVSVEDVDTFLANKGKRRWGRVSVSTSAKALRAFFRYAGARGWCAPSIAACIDGPRLFRHEGLPVGPPWPDVRRLIASTERDSVRDIRDRAILMLLATYGFRSGEVSGLCLENLNWESEMISIVRPKPRRVQEYPLRREAGEAILRYLQKVRPCCARREVFLTLRAPYRRLSQGALYHLVSTRLGALGVHVPRRGPHSLRHACAGRLLGEGFSLKEIGYHLGQFTLPRLFQVLQEKTHQTFSMHPLCLHEQASEEDAASFHPLSRSPSHFIKVESEPDIKRLTFRPSSTETGGRDLPFVTSSWLIKWRTVGSKTPTWETDLSMNTESQERSFSIVCLDGAAGGLAAVDPGFRLHRGPAAVVIKEALANEL